MLGALSNDRTDLSFTATAGPRQRSHFRVRVKRHSWSCFTVSESRLPNLQGQVPVFISPRNKMAVYTPKYWVPFRCLLGLAGLRWSYSNPLLRGRTNNSTSKSNLHYDRRSLGQSVSLWGTHRGPKTRFLLLSDSYKFLDVWRPLWREGGSVVYNCSLSSPAQSLWGLDLRVEGLVTIVYDLKF
jgi:hypothetical protein